MKYQIVKISFGALDTATPTSSANPLPVVQTGTLNVGTVTTVTTVAAVTAISNALPAGTNAIGKLAANSGVDIGDVDVTTVGTITPGTAATSLGKAEDAAHASADVGVMALAVRRNTASTTTDADGDYAPLIVDTNGRLHVNVGAGGIAGIVDDAAFTPATSEVLPIGMQADDTATDSVDEGDIGCPRMSLDRKQYVIGHQETGSIYQAGIAKTPAFAAISGATNGDNTLVAAAGASNKIRVTSLYLVSAGTTTVRFESGAGGTALSGVMSLIANTGLVLPHNPNGWFETAANTLLNMELNAAVQVSGSLSYIVVT